MIIIFFCEERIFSNKKTDMDQRAIFFQKLLHILQPAQSPISSSPAPESVEPKKKALPPALAARLAKRGILKVSPILLIRRQSVKLKGLIDIHEEVCEGF